MKGYYLTVLTFCVLVYGCAASLDLEPMMQDFSDYERDLESLTNDPEASAVVKMGLEKRAQARQLIDQGKKNEAAPLLEKALADMRYAVELDAMNASGHRAERCRLEVEKGRAKWEEALFTLRQTEEFVGKPASVTWNMPETIAKEKSLPASTLTPETFPPASIEEVSAGWNEWRGVARERSIAVADLEKVYRRSQIGAQAEKADVATVMHHTYLAARATQSVECRVRDHENELECVKAAQRTSELGEARADVLRAILELERSLQDDLRNDLEELRYEAKSRQDELYDALSQMEGKFASIRRDARGTIVSLADILFDFDKATLRREVEFNLVKIATILNQFPEMNILIEGHTDSIGTEEYNLDLSRRRAKAVSEFLATQDVAETRMKWEGYGESRPVADNDTDEGRQQNRRVDLVIQDTP